MSASVSDSEPDPFAQPLRWPELEERAQRLAAAFREAGEEEAIWHIADLTALRVSPSVLRRAEYLALGNGNGPVSSRPITERKN